MAMLLDTFTVQTAVLLLMAMVHGVQGVNYNTVAYVGQEAVLRCPLTELDTLSYPGWQKQVEERRITYAQDGGGRINPHFADRVSYASDNTSLVMENITLSDAGSYFCSAEINSVLREGYNTLHTRIRPQPPVISNRQSDGSVTGTEGKSLTLTCTSRGGNPEPTVTWYRGSTQTTVLSSSNSGTLDGNRYTVTATFTFRPISAYDGSIYICQTSYTSPKLDVLDSVNATLRLNLKPSQPIVVQDGDVEAESTVIIRCTTSGFRPVDSMAISWTYNGVNHSPDVTATPTSGTGTYTASSTLQFRVQKVDNGRRAACIVAHSTLETPLTGTATIDVHYAPESATVTGNNVIVANGANPLSLTCVVGERNPNATAISWTRTSRTGTVYDVSTQNPLVLRPTRDDDGDTVTCTANNTIGSVTSATATLKLRFHPITTATVSPTGAVTEGPTDVTLQCSAHSKPASTITWHHNDNTLQGAQQLSTTAHNTYVNTYKITSVSRQDAGEYKCIATNTVSTPTGDTSNTAMVTLVVQFPPLSATIEGNRDIEADGHNTLQLNCVVSESNPRSGLTWSRTGTVDIGTTHAMYDMPGSYGGHTRSQVLELTPTRDDDGDTITCTAGNGVGQSDPVTHTITLNLKYNAIASIPRGDETVVEGATSKDLTCNANSKPAATFTWYKGTSSTALVSGPGTGSGNQWTSTYSIDGVERNHTGQYRCVAGNGVGAVDEKTMTLTVKFPPLSAIIEGNREIEADGQNKLQLKCVVGESNPMSAITWSNTGIVDIGNTYAMQDVTGSYGGSTRSQVLVLTPIRGDDGNTITCTAGNGDGQTVTHTITLNLNYTAIASIPRGDETVVEGATSKDLTCNANSKPAATFTWYKGTSSTALVSGPGTGSGNQWTSTYSIDGVDRSHAGQYRCVAGNGVGAVDEKNITLTVYYPPDVTAITRLNNGQLVATCSPVGVPNSYLYSNWVHLWSDGTPISHTPPLAATQPLMLTPLTYQDSGIYTCGAGNEVGPNGAMPANYMNEGSASVITINSLPIIIGPAEQKVPIILHEPTTVSITYYSNVAGSTVSCHRVVDNITQPQSVGVVTTETSPIKLLVYESMVSQQGTSATVNLTLDTKDELGAYVVVLTNAVGTAVVHLLAVPEGPPEKPIDPRVEDVYTTSVNVSWELGYHGGPGQIFIIQYSTDGETWTDGATLDTGNSTSQDRHYVTVESLNPETLYSLKIHAKNKHGRSLDTDMINVTTSTIAEEGDSLPVGAIAGAAAGGLGGAAIVIVGIVLFIRCRRSGTSGKDQAGLVMKDRRKFEDEESTGTGMIDNLVYVSADEVPPGMIDNLVYQSADDDPIVRTGNGDVNANKPTPQTLGLDPSVIYAPVNKPKRAPPAVTPSTSGAAGINVYEDVVDNSKPSSSGNVEPVYSVVDKSNGAKVLPSTSGVASSDYAVVVKSKTPSPGNEDPMSLYSVVDKSNVAKGGKVDDKKKGKNKKDGKKEKKHKEKKADKKGKGAKAKKGASRDPGTVYENATNLMYENAKDLTKNKNGEENVYENPEDSKPKLAPKPKPTRNVNEEGCIYLDLDFKQEKGRELIIRGLENSTDYADVEFCKVGPPCPDSDKEDDKTDDKKV